MKNLKILLIVFFSIFVSTIFWNLIASNFKIVKYIIFILVPLFTFLITKKKFYPTNTIKFNNLLTDNNREAVVSKKFFISEFIFIFFLLYLIVEFHFLDFFLFKVDTQHEGNYLVPFQNYQSSLGKIWVSSYFAHGVSDLFYPILGLKLFNYSTIGSFRFSFLLIILFLKLLSIILANELSKLSNLDTFNKKVLFFFLGISFLSLSDYEIPLNYSPFAARHIFTLAFLIFFIQIFQANQNSIIRTFFYFFISVISSSSIIFHTDIGIYLNIVLFLYIFYLFLKKEYSDIFLILFFVLAFWIGLTVSLGGGEILLFFEQFLLTIKNIETIHGLEYQYPSPFFSIGSKDGMRATRGLVMQITAGIFIFNYIISKNNYPNNYKIFFLFLYILSFFSYFNALGRADSYHMKMSTGLPIIINIFFLLHILIKKIDANNFINYKIQFKNKIFYISSSVLFIIFIIFNTNFIKNINFIFKKDYQYYFSINDDFFLDNETNNFIKFYSKISSKDRCVQNFTDDLILSFLLKKPSCTKYFSSVFAISSKLQEDYIKELISANPEYIIYKSEKFKIDNKHPAEKLKIINNFILYNYKRHSIINNYEIFIKK
jgi:hypothetical protein